MIARAKPSGLNTAFNRLAGDEVRIQFVRRQSSNSCWTALAKAVGVIYSPGGVVISYSSSSSVSATGCAFEPTKTRGPGKTFRLHNPRRT